MSVVEELRQNDPARTKFYIPLRFEGSDADLAQALEQNLFVTEIQLSLEGERRDWNYLLRVIATHAKLENVQLMEGVSAAVLVRSILRAMQQNTAIRNVYLGWLRLPTDISTFLDNASSITSFCLYKCDMDPAEWQQGTSNLVAALQRNANIETLELGRLDDIYAIAILEGLQINTSVKNFVFSPCVLFSDASSHALQHLLESTTSIQRFELQDETFRGERTFRPIAQAITSSKCVSKLKFLRCNFYDQSSIAQFQSILQNKCNLTSLCLDTCTFGGGQVYRDIISILLRPGSLLRCFEFQTHWPLEGVTFEVLLQAIEKSRLERFQIRYMTTLQQLQTLTQSIPSTKLKELEVSFRDFEGSGDEDDEEEEGEFGRETIRHDLLHAVKTNFSLRSVKGDLNSDDLFGTAEDKETLAFYANRNKRLDQWVENPETIVDRKVWPEALGLAQRAGPNALFHGLRLVLESDYVSLPSVRKRKRPQHYAPS